MRLHASAVGSSNPLSVSRVLGLLTVASVVFGPASRLEYSPAPAMATSSPKTASAADGQPQVSLPKEANGDWWSRVQKDMRANEYHATWSEHTNLPDVPAAFQAPNRAQDLRTYFTPKGARLVSRTETTSTWSVNLGAQAIGRGAALNPLGEARIVTNANRVEYVRPGFTEWYVNDERGLEQGFTIDAPPVGDGPLVLRLADGETAPKLSDDGAIEFFTASGARVLRYAELKAFAKDGRTLESTMAVKDGAVELSVVAAEADYPVTIDPLATSPDWTAEVNQGGAQFGYSVASAGDVNGDGYADVIIGAPLFDNGQRNEGRAYIFHGGASGLSASAPWSANGDQVDAVFGSSVSSAGDVNGDGYTDVVVGAYLYSNGQASEGRAYVYHGGASGLSTTASWTAESDQAGSRFGFSVSSAGDVNGDGYADVVVGASSYNNGQASEGRAYVYHGGASGLSTTASWTAESDQLIAQFGTSVSSAGDVNGDGYADVIVGAPMYNNGENQEGRAFVYNGSATGLSPTASWTAESNQEFADFGGSVSSAGDVNGDGYADVVVGAPFYSNGEVDEGRVFVFHGASGGLPATPSWTAESNQAAAEFGRSIASVGDVNGDGYADVIVGAFHYQAGESAEGRAFLYHGSADGLSTISDWTAESNQAGAEFGAAVSGAGDVNGDGYADVIVGATQYDNGQVDEGRAFMYHGSASGLSASESWTAESNQANASFGVSVSSAGDVNGDGYGDVIVGASTFDNAQAGEGRAYVYHGTATGLSTSASWTAESNQAFAGFGRSVSSAGDVNGDGYGDVIVGAYVYDNGQANEGRAYVYHGSASGLSASASWTAESNQGGSQFGTSVSSAGDVNGDGYGDVVVGANVFDNGQLDEGRVYVYHGSASGLLASASWTAEADQANAQYGSSVSSAGDVNGDGYADVIVGAQSYDNGETDEGRAFVYHGSASGLSASAAWTAESNQAVSGFGLSVSSAGDVNGDGYGDVVVGAYAYGRAFVYHGNSEGRLVRAQQKEGVFPSVVQAWGLSQSPNSFRVSLNATSPMGRVRVKLRVEACPSGLPFGNGGCTTSTQPAWTDVGLATTGAVLTHQITGLTAGAVYHWRARVLYAPYRVTSGGITPPPNPIAGPWRRLDAQARAADIQIGSLPSVVNPTSASITSSTATLGGQVTAQGGSPVIERGIVYALTAVNPNPEVGGPGATSIPVIGATGVFTTGVTGLDPATVYSFRAYATNVVGTGYTSADTFATTFCPTITLSSLPNGVAGTSYSGATTASGGAGPYTYAVTSGSIPTGLSLNSPAAGNVTGTPSVTGSFTFEVTATDTATSCSGVQSYTVHIGSVVAPGDLVIREFRSRGPAGAEDEFIEIANRSMGPLVIVAPDGSAGFGIAAESVGLLATIPNGTVIPRGGFFLAANTTPGTGYSLSDYGAPGAATRDATWTTDLTDNTGIGLFTSATSFTAGTVLDAVGFVGSLSPYLEGTGIPVAGPTGASEVTYARTETAAGVVDTGNSAADFHLGDTNAAVFGSVTATLASPGPQNLTSERSTGLTFSLADPTKGATVFPNRFRVGITATTGTYYFRWKITNNTGGSITKLRVRVGRLSTLNAAGYAPGGPNADFRLVASSDVAINVPGTVTARGLTVQAPPTGLPLSGGYNASAEVALPGGTLADGAFVYINLAFKYEQAGNYSYFVSGEAK